jgi:hypothetical protein
MLAKRFEQFLIVVFLGLAPGAVARADLVVDYSPDTTGKAVGAGGYNYLAYLQMVGDRFTLSADTFVTGAAIFSSNTAPASLGEAVRLFIFADIGGTPDTTPLYGIPTKLDAIDTAYTTSQSSLTRKHATISSLLLPAGTYWFSMPGEKVDVMQAVSATPYDDGLYRYGYDTVNHSAIDLHIMYDGGQDMFFQIEGVAVPEPTALALATVAGMLGLAMMRMSVSLDPLTSRCPPRERPPARSGTKHGRPLP